MATQAQKKSEEKVLFPGRAKDKAHYIECWNAHIRELDRLGFPAVATGNLERLYKLQQDLKNLVVELAEHEFSEE